MKNNKHGNEYLKISNSIAIKSDTPFYGSVFDFITFEKLIKEYFKSVKELNNPRHVILETWLLVDFVIRILLSTLFNLTRFNSEKEKFDVRYDVLARGFTKNTSILKKILKIQRSLPEKPVDNSIKIDIKFGLFFMKKYKKEYKKYLDIIQEYYKKYHSELVKNGKVKKMNITSTMPIISKSDIFKVPKRYCVNKSFIKSLKIIDKNWFKNASELNDARNVASHSYDQKKILSAFRCKGVNSPEKAKKRCLTLIKNLLGIVKPPIKLD